MGLYGTRYVFFFQPERLGDTALHILASMPNEEDICILRTLVSDPDPMPYS